MLRSMTTNPHIEEERVMRLVNDQSVHDCAVAVAYSELWNSDKRQTIDWDRIHRAIDHRWSPSALGRIVLNAHKDAKP